MPSVVPFKGSRHAAADDKDTSLLARPLLLARLEQATRNPVCVLHAPTGSGKTVLIEQLYQQVRLNQAVTRFTLDDTEHDPIRFFRHLGQAIRQALPDFAGFTSLQRHSHDTTALATLAMNVMVNALQRVEEPLLIIIDNIERLAGQPWLAALRHTISLSPPQVHWVLSGRNTESIEPLQWELNEPFALLTSTHLFFSRDDTRALLQMGREIPLDDAQLESLLHYTKGWPAALKLAQICLQLNANHSDIVDERSNRNMLGALLDATLDRMDSDLRNFLILTSILETVSAPLCDHMLNAHNSVQHIEQLKKWVLLIEPIHPQMEFRYHTLLQERLREHYERRPRSERDRLIARACLWLVDHQQRNQACRLARQHSQNNFFTELMQQSFRVWICAGDADSVFHWVNALGENGMLAFPDFRFAESWALTLLGELIAAEEVLLRTLPAEHATEKNRETLFTNTDTTQAATAITFATIHLLRGDRGDALLKPLLRLYNAPTLPNVHRTSIDNLLALRAIHRCRFREAHQRATQAMQRNQKTDHRLGHFLGIYLIANSYHQNNDTNNAKAVCKRHLDAPDVQPNSTEHAMLRGFDAYLDYQGHRPLAAEKKIHDILLTSQPGFSLEIQTCITLPLLHMKTRRQEFLAAHFLLLQLEQAVHASGAIHAHAHMLYERVRLELACGHSNALARLEQEHRLLENGALLLENRCDLTWEARERRIMAAILVLLHQGKLEQALQWTQRLQYLNVDHGYPIRFLPLNVCLAYIDFRLGHISTAFRRLNDSLTQAEATGMLTGLLDDIPGLDDFVKTAIRQERILNPLHVRKLQSLGILDLEPAVESIAQQTMETALQASSNAAREWHTRNLLWMHDQIALDARQSV